MRQAVDELVKKLEVSVNDLDKPIKDAKTLGKQDLAAHLAVLQVQVLSAVRMYRRETEETKKRGGHE